MKNLDRFHLYVDDDNEISEEIPIDGYEHLAQWCRSKDVAMLEGDYQQLKCKCKQQQKEIELMRCSMPCLDCHEWSINNNWGIGRSDNPLCKVCYQWTVKEKDKSNWKPKER